MTTASFHESISKLLSQKLASFKSQDLNALVCTQIYEIIFETITTLFTTVSAPLDNEAANYIAQQYYDGILINDRQELDPNIFKQRAKLENIPTKELAFMSMLLVGTDFRLPVVEEIKKRS